MFYPENSLKKGGRFHLCWVADSWPDCFATITQRQLWSQDIRKICHDLLQVMTNESGRPTQRFSLRLSSQLMRGLVRLYQKKVNSVLIDICMINARIMKSSNRKFNIQDSAEEVEQHMVTLLELPAPAREPVPEAEERVEEMIRQSGNVVSNIEDITLKEAAIPEFQLPPTDGFGEQNPDQALQMLQDRTLEQMLGAAPHSTLNVTEPGAAGAAGAPGAAADKSPARTRLQIDKTMERLSDHDVTLFRKSTAQDLLPQEPDKEMTIPEIPPPDLPAPTEKEPPLPEPEAVPEPPPAQAPVPPQPAPQEPEIVTLETLEEGEPQAKRRRKHTKLIIDKNNQLNSKVYRARIANIHVDLRCEDSTDDIADLRVPVDILLHRPARAGARFPCVIARELSRLFSRNLGYAAAAPFDQREMERALASRGRRATPPLEIIAEEPAPVQEPRLPEPAPAPELQPVDTTMLDKSAAVPDLNVDVEDIALLPTQKLATTPQKRASQEIPSTSQTKRARGGNESFRERNLSQNLKQYEQEIVEKENIPENWQTLPPRRSQEQWIVPGIQIQRPSDPERVLCSLLQEAGLADSQVPHVPQPEPHEPHVPHEPQPTEEQETRRRRTRGSGSSETMLGSLDRTKVSLGDSDQTTDSMRFIRDQWGTEGTMLKILNMVKAEIEPLNFNTLLSSGPLMPGHKRIIAARCFTSILKLKQYGFIRTHKDPDSTKIIEICLGPKFDNLA